MGLTQINYASKLPKYYDDQYTLNDINKTNCHSTDVVTSIK